MQDTKQDKKRNEIVCRQDKGFKMNSKDFAFQYETKEGKSTEY